MEDKVNTDKQKVDTNETDKLILTQEQLKSLIDFWQIDLLNLAHYYFVEASKDNCGFEEMSGIRNDIEKKQDALVRIIKSNGVIENLEDIEEIANEISFDIFCIISNSDPIFSIDNPEWLYNLMCVWKEAEEISKNKSKNVLRVE